MLIKIVMKKFIELTDTRELVGIEEIRNCNTLLNVDQIVSIQSVEPRIAEELGYNTTIVTTKNNYYVLETMEYIENYLGWLSQS
jgi:hypothetical protein